MMNTIKSTIHTEAILAMMNNTATYSKDVG